MDGHRTILQFSTAMDAAATMPAVAVMPPFAPQGMKSDHGRSINGAAIVARSLFG